MTDREKLSKAVGSVAWGYIFIYFNFNLGPIDILPNFVGYFFILNSIDTLAKEEKSTALLKPLVYILIVWEILKWLNAFVNITLDGYIYTLVNTIVIVVSLYYNFQLFTNLASIAEKYFCKEKDGILTLRTVYTIMITTVSLLGVIKINEDIMDIISLGLVAVTVVIIISTSVVLFGFKKSLTQEII